MPRDVDSLNLIAPEHKWASDANADILTSLTDGTFQNVTDLTRQSGWNDDFSRDGGSKPRRETFNTIFRDNSSNIIELNRHGAGLEWNATISYLHPAIIAYDDGNGFRYYISLKGDGVVMSADNNLNRIPSNTSEGFWIDLAAVLRHATTTLAGIVELATLAETVAGIVDSKAVTPASLPNADEINRGMIRRSTENEATTATNNSKAMTPLRTAQYVSGRTASQTQAGIVERATQAEVNAGTDDQRVSPATLAQRLGTLSVSPASTTQAGIVERATQAEVNAGNDDERYVSPAGLEGRTATETRVGLVERATQAEVNAGNDDERYVSPATLEQRISSFMTSTPAASTTQAGIVERATQAEVNAGNDDERYVSPAGLEGRTATETRVGLVERATQAEVNAGNDDERYVSPATLEQRISSFMTSTPAASTTQAGISELATNTEAQAQTSTTRVITASNLNALTPTGTRLGMVRVRELARSVFDAISNKDPATFYVLTS